jgi:hypothetical protein
MSKLEMEFATSKVSKDEVVKELQKIFRSPAFRDSLILKKFLTFIVDETIEGRSNCLKEYTVALSVLNKPHDFNPQLNGIVRIHAGRLRKALVTYYSSEGAGDEVQISIPKGNYIPQFNIRA